MRLINADTLFEDIRFDREAAKVHPQEMCERLDRFCDYAEALVKEAPTIDAEPVRHGRWRPKKVDAVTTEFECSECGRTVTRANDYFGKATKYVSSYYPYCHCGAKMDLEVQHD